MRLLIPLLALAMAGCTVTVHRLGPVGSTMGDSFASGDPGADAGSLLLNTQLQRDRALDAFSADRFLDPSMGLDFVGPQLDPTLLDPTLRNPWLMHGAPPNSPGAANTMPSGPGLGGGGGLF